MSTFPGNAEDRAKGLAASADARWSRAKLKRQVTHGSMTLAELLQQGSYGSGDEAGAHARIAGHIHAVDAVKAIKGVGKVRSAKILEAAQIDPSRPLDTLNEKQRRSLLDAVEAEGYEAR